MGGYALERVERVCAAAGDARELRLRLVEEIRRVVGFDGYAWLLTDPETCVGVAPLADVPFLGELPRAIALKYLTHLNRWTGLTGSPVGLLLEATDGRPERSLMWRELLGGYGVGDVASSVYRDRFGCWGFLDLYRVGGRFDRGDAAFLAAIAGVVTGALRRCQAGTFMARPERPDRVGPVVLVLSGGLEVLGQTPETQEYLRVLVPPDEGRPPIPASAFNVGAQLLAVEAGVDPNPAAARVHLAGGLWLTLRAARLGGGPVEARDIAVTIEETPPADRITLFARAFGFSARETELLGRLAPGGDTREIAARMFVSEHTVQDYLKSIFAKTSAPNRRVLLARALGT